MTKWDKLIGKLEARRSTLVGFKDLVGLFREMDGAHGDMQDIEVKKLLEIVYKLKLLRYFKKEKF